MQLTVHQSVVNVVTLLGVQKTLIQIQKQNGKLTSWYKSFWLSLTKLSGWTKKTQFKAWTKANNLIGNHSYSRYSNSSAFTDHMTHLYEFMTHIYDSCADFSYQMLSNCCENAENEASAHILCKIIKQPNKYNVNIYVKTSCTACSRQKCECSRWCSILHKIHHGK